MSTDRTQEAKLAIEKLVKILKKQIATVKNNLVGMEPYVRYDYRSSKAYDYYQRLKTIRWRTG